MDIVYQDGEGRVSRRRVEVVRWSHARSGFTYLRAYCFLREEERTFRGDRIVEWRVVERDGPPTRRDVPTFVPIVPPRPIAPPSVPSAAITIRAPMRAVQGPAVPVTIAPVPVESRARRRGRRFLELVGVAIAITVVRGLVSAADPPRPAYVPTPPAPAVVPAPRPAPKPVPKPAPRPAPKPAPRPAPKPAPSPQPYAAPDPAPDPSVPSDPPAIPDARALAFRAATGIESPGLEAIYRGADRDGDDALDWDELAAFQAWLDRTYAYRANAPALRPDEFLAQGGGDCEDWALFTCGLLRWWGWDPYVGSFAPSAGAVGHAVCLVRLDARPARLRWWSVDGDGYLGGYSVKAGWYVPVDYEKVGDLTNAVGDGWRLRAVWTPEAIYGEEM